MVKKISISLGIPGPDLFVVSNMLSLSNLFNIALFRHAYFKIVHRLSINKSTFHFNVFHKFHGFFFSTFRTIFDIVGFVSLQQKE